ncbi:hypothetical protein GCM10011497_27800 [Elstera cyanobacteriorum]|nr:hypothetical protein GCM10011497_27800 [Elstera cyanobacteriorum]
MLTITEREIDRNCRIDTAREDQKKRHRDQGFVRDPFIAEACCRKRPRPLPGNLQKRKAVPEIKRAENRINRFPPEEDKASDCEGRQEMGP